jgi:hypothetical protein
MPLSLVTGHLSSRKGRTYASGRVATKYQQTLFMCLRVIQDRLLPSLPFHIVANILSHSPPNPRPVSQAKESHGPCAGLSLGLPFLSTPSSISCSPLEWASCFFTRSVFYTSYSRSLVSDWSLRLFISFSLAVLIGFRLDLYLFPFNLLLSLYCTV